MVLRTASTTAASPKTRFEGVRKGWQELPPIPVMLTIATASGNLHDVHKVFEAGFLGEIGDVRVAFGALDVESFSVRPISCGIDAMPF